MKPFPGEFTIDILNPGQGFHSSEFCYNEFKNRYSIIEFGKQRFDINGHEHGGYRNVYLLQQKSGQKRCFGKVSQTFLTPILALSLSNFYFLVFQIRPTKRHQKESCN